MRNEDAFSGMTISSSFSFITPPVALVSAASNVLRTAESVIYKCGIMKKIVVVLRFELLRL